MTILVKALAIKNVRGVNDVNDQTRLGQEE